MLVVSWATKLPCMFWTNFCLNLLSSHQTLDFFVFKNMCKLYQLSTHINNFLRWYCSKKGASCDRFTIVWLQFEKICLILSELIQNNLWNWTHLDALQVFLMQKRKKPNFYVKFFFLNFYCVCQRLICFLIQRSNFT